MKTIEVKTQAELDATLKSSEAHDRIIITGSGSEWFTVRESAHVEASKFVAIHKQSRHTGTIKGGVVIKVREPRTAAEWCDFYGVKRERGIVILFKAVHADFKSHWGTSYEPGTMPKAADWDGGAAECGGGLHFCPSVYYAKSFDSNATRFIACPVRVSEIAVHKNASYPYKVKEPRVAKPCWEVDEFGKKIEPQKQSITAN